MVVVIAIFMVFIKYKCVMDYKILLLFFFYSILVRELSYRLDFVVYLSDYLLREFK